MHGETYRPTSVGNWLVTLIVLSIPVVNFICCLWWAFSDQTPVSKANFAKALLVWFLIVVSLYVLVIGAAFNRPF